MTSGIHCHQPQGFLVLFRTTGLILLSLALLVACVPVAMPPPTPEMPPTSPSTQAMIETVPVIGWLPTEDNQVESNDFAFAWHAMLATRGAIYVVYSLASGQGSDNSPAAIPTGAHLRTDDTSGPKPGHAVPLNTWRGASTGVLVFPGCLDKARFVQVEFDELSIGQDVTPGEWILRLLANPSGTVIPCESELLVPRNDYLTTADKTISFNGDSNYLGDRLADLQLLSRGLPFNPSEVNPGKVPDDATASDHGGDDPTAALGATPTAALADGNILARMTLRIVDNPSGEVQFVVLDIRNDGEIEAQIFEGTAAVAAPSTPTLPETPVPLDFAMPTTTVLNSLEEAQVRFPDTLRVPAWPDPAPRLEKIDTMDLVSGMGAQGNPQNTILIGLYYSNGIRLDQQTVPPGTRLEDKLSAADDISVEVNGYPARGTQAATLVSPITGESYTVDSRLYWLEGDVFYLITSPDHSIEELHVIAESLQPWQP